MKYLNLNLNLFFEPNKHQFSPTIISKTINYAYLSVRHVSFEE